MNEIETNPVTDAFDGPESTLRKFARSVAVWLVFGLMGLIFAYRMVSWVLASLFYPAATDLGLHAFRFDYVIRNDIPLETLRPWFITSGFVTLVRFLSALPFEYRAPAAHLLDDALMFGLLIMGIAWSRRHFSSSWPALIAVTSLVSRAFGSNWTDFLNRDWYAGIFSVMAILVAGASNSKRAAILGGTLWVVGLQFRPQSVLLLPCLALARLSLCQETRLNPRSFVRAMSDTAIGLAVGFVLVHVPLWFMGGFPAYYVDTLQFLRQGGHSGRTKPGLILSNAAKIILKQDHFAWICVLSTIPLLVMQASIRRGHLIWLLVSLYSVAAAILWASVNPVVNPYHWFPIFIAESVALATITGYASTLFSTRTETPRVLVLVMGFAFALWPDAAVIVRASAMNSIVKFKAGDYSPVFESSKGVPFPPTEWKLDRKANRELFEFLGNSVDSPVIPCELIVTNEKHINHPYFLRNPGVVGTFLSWNSLSNTVGLNGEDEFRRKFEIFQEKLRGTPDGFVLWIPIERNSQEFRFGNLDVSVQARKLFDIITAEYEPVARFGEVEIRRKKQASSAPEPAPGG